MVVRTSLLGGVCSLIEKDLIVFSRDGQVPQDRCQGAGLILALVLVHLWLH